MPCQHMFAQCVAQSTTGIPYVFIYDMSAGICNIYYDNTRIVQYDSLVRDDHTNARIINSPQCCCSTTNTKGPFMSGPFMSGDHLPTHSNLYYQYDT